MLRVLIVALVAMAALLLVVRGLPERQRRPAGGALADLEDEAAAASRRGPGVYARVVGVVQDGGLPHLGCTRDCCEAARRGRAPAGRVAALALIVVPEEGPRRVFMVDATPDLRSQIDAALGAEGREERPPGLPLDGILLTHAHVGHYAGLIYLGRESLGARGVPVHATARMASFLAGSGPWSRLVAQGNVALRRMEPGRPVTLASGLTATPLRVPHREEESDAVGFLVQGPERRLLYVPDIDDWARWDQDPAALIAPGDAALLDGTFYDAAEASGRRIEEIPHPLVPATMDRLERLPPSGRRVLFIHLNHTNPALRPGSPERRAIERRGFEVAADGLELRL